MLKACSYSILSQLPLSLLPSPSPTTMISKKKLYAIFFLCLSGFNIHLHLFYHFLDFSFFSSSGEILIEREKKRLQELRQRASTEAINQWEERRRCESASATMSSLHTSPKHALGSPLYYNSDSANYFSDCASVSSFESIEGRLDAPGVYSGHSTPIRSINSS